MTLLASTKWIEVNPMVISFMLLQLIPSPIHTVALIDILFIVNPFYLILRLYSPCMSLLILWYIAKIPLISSNSSVEFGMDFLDGPVIMNFVFRCCCQLLEDYSALAGVKMG